jgi:hypothetical protein
MAEISAGGKTGNATALDVQHHGFIRSPNYKDTSFVEYCKKSDANKAARVARNEGQ